MKRPGTIHAPTEIGRAGTLGSKLTEIDEAFAKVIALSSGPVSGTETISLCGAAGRNLTQDIASPIPLPPFDNSAMDGFGLPAAMVGRGVPFRTTVRGRLYAGSTPSMKFEQDGVIRVLTGAALPPWVEAVVAEEGCRFVGSDLIEIRRSSTTGANIRRRGEDVPMGGVLVDQGATIDARHVAILAAAGFENVMVRRRVRVGVLSTGSELSSPSMRLSPGSIYDANGPMLRAVLASPHLELIDLARQSDHLPRLAECLASAAETTDVIVTSGGVSGSEADHVPAAVVTAGGSAELLRLALKPGKPLLAGRIGRVPVLGLPGNPLSALINLLLFGRPLVSALAGLPAIRPRGQVAILAAAVSHTPGRTEFAPARIARHDGEGRPVIEKIMPSGSARLRTAVIADGFLEIPAGAGDLPSGARLQFHPAATLS
jgi:molybdopterin molybdotransferase